MTATMLAADLARIIKDTALFACVDSGLPMIHAVRFESTPKHLVAVATDRFTLGASVGDWHDEEGEEFATLLALKDAQLVVKVATSVKAAFTNVTITPTETAVRFAFAGGQELLIPKVTGTFDFPDWRKLMDTARRSADEAEAVRNFGMNPQYIARFARVTDSRRMTLKFSGPQRPALVSVGTQFFGLIMPVRLDEDDLAQPMPEWLARPAVAKPETKKPRVRKQKAAVA